MSGRDGNPLAEDLDQVLERTRELWSELRGARLFLTGGTGFFGTWLLETFLWASDALGLGAEVVALSRDPEAFARKAPRLAAHPALVLHKGDQITFGFPAGTFDMMIHAAVEYGTPLATFEHNLWGTGRVLELARRAGARRFLLTSSGAVYGPQPADLDRIPEDHPGSPDLGDPASAYGLSKRAAEFLGNLQQGMAFTAARCFAFVGPHLPLDRNGAMGNFLADALRGGPIVVQGDGSPVRSYLYAADLAVWLWTILVRGVPGRAYNVGGEEAVSIRRLAERVAAVVSPGAAVEVLRPEGQARPSRYVPDVRRAREELGLAPWVPLDDAIARTARYLRAGRGGDWGVH